MLPVALVSVARVSVRSVSHLPGLKDKNQISITILACVNKKDGKFQNYSSFVLCKCSLLKKHFTECSTKLLLNNNEKICNPTIMQNPRKK